MKFRVFSSVLFVCAVGGVGFPLQRAIAVTLSSGDLVVSDYGFGGVIRISPTTGAQTVIASGGTLTHATGVAVMPDGSLLACAETGYISRINPVTGAVTTILSPTAGASPGQMAVEPSGKVLIVDRPSARGFSGSSRIMRLDPATGSYNLVSAATQPDLLDVISSGDNAYVTYGSSTYILAGAVNRLDTGTGNQTGLNTSAASRVYSGVAALPTSRGGIAAGTLFVADLYQSTFPTTDRRIIRVDAVTGLATEVAKSGNIKEPRDLAFSLDGTSLFVTDYGTFTAGQILKIDPVTGVQSVISSGGNLLYPGEIAVVPDPTGPGLLACIGVCLFSRRRRRGSLD